MTEVLTIGINGIVLGFLYLMFVIGLTIIFGMLNVINYAHGAYYALGAYLAYTLAGAIGFAGVLLAVPLIVGVLGVLTEVFLIRRVYKAGHVPQILLTYGLLLIIQESIAVAWGLTGKNLNAPELLSGVFDLGYMQLPKYRLFVIVLAAVSSLLVWFCLVRTKAGTIIRAGIEDSEMVACLGINVRVVFTMAFAVGVALAGFAGVLALPIRGADPSMGIDILVISFVIVVIGGLGSFAGAVAGAFLVGLSQAAMAQIWPAAGGIVIFVLMVLVLLVRPQGLFGRA